MADIPKELEENGPVVQMSWGDNVVAIDFEAVSCEVMVDRWRSRAGMVL